jgi:hypothetical protein
MGHLRESGLLEGRGLQGDLAVRVADRFFQALADLVRDREPLSGVFHPGSRLSGWTGP